MFRASLFEDWGRDGEDAWLENRYYPPVCRGCDLKDGGEAKRDDFDNHHLERMQIVAKAAL
jgi:hypothetical protein